jgi:trehalose 6-phosphate synthase/phosphatase
VSRRTALASYQPKASDPDDEKKTGYVPAWLDDADALGTMRGIVRLVSASLLLFV